MRSARVTPNTVATPSDYNALINDAVGAARILAHQQYGNIALPTNPTNGQTLTLDINGTNVVITFVSSIGSTAGNVLIQGSAALTAAALLNLLLNPTISNANQVALGTNTSANVTLVNYINWSLAGTNLNPSSYNAVLYAPATSFSASTTVTGGSYTANTMALYVEPGVVYVGGVEVYFLGGATPTVTGPSSHPRIDVLTLDNTGTLAWTTGAENVSPSAPTYPAGKVPIVELYNVVGETALYDNANQTSGQGYILNDVRPIVGSAVNLSAIASSILPSVDATYALGGASFRWTAVYAQEYYGDASNMTGLSSNDISDVYTAGMNGNAGDALCALPFSSVAVTLDAKAALSGTSSSSVTQAFTVGSNSNRVLVLGITYTTGGGSISGITYAGSSMTKITDEANNSGHSQIWYLMAPSTGSNNIVISISGASVNVSFNAYSYYNAAQTSTPEANAENTGGGTESVTITPLSNGSLVFGLCGSGGTLGGATNNTITGGAAVTGDTGGIYPISAQTISGNGTSNTGSVHAISIAPFQSSVTMRVYQTSSKLAATVAGFIGFATTSYTAAGTVRAVIGGTATGLSGLSIGSQYYLNDTAGTIGTGAGTVTRKAGIALSATTLLITNIW